MFSYMRGYYNPEFVWFMIIDQIIDQICETKVILLDKDCIASCWNIDVVD